MKTRKLKRIGCIMAALCMLFLECASVGAKEMPAAEMVAPAAALSRMAEFSQCVTGDDGLVYGIVSIQSKHSFPTRRSSDLSCSAERRSDGQRCKA